MEVTVTEKLKRLVSDTNRAALDRRAGLPRNTTANILNKGIVPGLSNAQALARALDVSLDWLADDSRGWPPEPAGSEVADSILPRDVRAIWDEICGRYRGRAVCTAAAIDAFIRAEFPTQTAAIADAFMRAHARDAAPPRAPVRREDVRLLSDREATEATGNPPAPKLRIAASRPERAARERSTTGVIGDRPTGLAIDVRPDPPKRRKA